MIARPVQLDWIAIMQNFRRAVGSDAMGWFCEKYNTEFDLMKLEWQAASSLHLISLVAAILADQRR